MHASKYKQPTKNMPPKKNEKSGLPKKQKKNEGDKHVTFETHAVSDDSDQEVPLQQVGGGGGGGPVDPNDNDAAHNTGPGRGGVRVPGQSQFPHGTAHSTDKKNYCIHCKKWETANKFVSGHGTATEKGDDCRAREAKLAEERKAKKEAKEAKKGASSQPASSSKRHPGQVAQPAGNGGGIAGAPIPEMITGTSRIKQCHNLGYFHNFVFVPGHPFFRVCTRCPAYQRLLHDKGSEISADPSQIESGQDNENEITSANREDDEEDDGHFSDEEDEFEGMANTFNQNKSTGEEDEEDE